MTTVTTTFPGLLLFDLERIGGRVLHTPHRYWRGTPTRQLIDTADEIDVIVDTPELLAKAAAELRTEIELCRIYYDMIIGPDWPAIYDYETHGQGQTDK